VGDQVSGGRPFGQALDTLSRALALALEPGERAIVLGDLAESAAAPVRRLREVAGLVARRQIALWGAPEPWVALVALALPLGILLSHVSRFWSDGSVVYLRAYVEGFTWTYVANPGSRQDLIELGALFLVSAVALCAWSWTAGFALVRLARRTFWVSSGVFAVALFAGTLGTFTTARGPFGLGLTDSHFYGLVLPRLIRACLVLLPFWLGARAARFSGALTVTRALAAALVTLALTAWTTVGVEGAVSYGRSQPWAGPGLDGVRGTGDDPRPLPLRLIPLTLLLPAAYLGFAAVTSLRPRPVKACSGQAQRR
jgi:hypothetical protein